MKHLIYTLIIAGFIVTSCEDNNANNTYAEIEAELEQILNEDAMFGLDGFGDEGAAPEEYQEGLEEPSLKLAIDDDYPPDSIWTYHFGRQINSVERDVQYTHEEDEVLAEITCTITGNFIVEVYDTTDVMVDSATKPFTKIFQRKVRFEEIEGENENDPQWRVKEFTLGVGGIGEKVAITKLEYFVLDQDSTTWNSTFSMEAENILDTFIAREDLPTFQSRSVVKIEVTVTNEEPVYDFRSGEKVMMHFGRDRRHKGRRVLSDDGIHGGDLVPLNNVFTRIMFVHGPGPEHNTRVFRTFFDVMDFGTLFQMQEDVHSAFWGIPYRVNRH